MSLIQKTNLLLVVVKNSPECAFHETKSACLSCLGNVYQAYSPFVRMSKQTAYGDILFRSDTVLYETSRLNLNR